MHKSELAFAQAEKEKWTREKFDNLSPLQKNIHEKAFVVNSGDPHQHELTPLNYSDDGVPREINIPKGRYFRSIQERRRERQTANGIVAGSAGNFFRSSECAVVWFMVFV